MVETLPPGFSYTGSNLSDDAVIVSGREVTFFLRGEERFTYTGREVTFFLRGEERFTYTVTAPGAAREYPPTPTPTPTSRAVQELLPTPTPSPRPRRRRAGEHSFFGGLVNENRLQQTVGGASSIRVGAAPLVYAINDAATLVRIDSPIPVTVTFSEPVFGFSFDDISVANGAISNFTVAAGEAVYTLDVTPNAIGTRAFSFSRHSRAGGNLYSLATGKLP